MNTFAELLQEPAAAPTWPAALPDHLSASALGMYRRCAEQFRRRYVLGERERPNVKLLWGISDHRALEVNWQQKIDSHEDVPVDDVKEAFAAALDEAVEESGGEGEVNWEGKKPGEIKDAGVQLAAAYHTIASPQVQPVAVERKFSLTVPDVPVPVIGYIDIETATGVVERKTAARKFTVVPGKYMLQAAVYQIASRQPLDFHVSVKTKTPQVILPSDEPGLRSGVSPARLAWSERIVQSTVRSLLATYEAYGPDQPWPDAIAAEGPCFWCGWGPKGTNVCAWWKS